MVSGSPGRGRRAAAAAVPAGAGPVARSHPRGLRRPSPAASLHGFPPVIDSGVITLVLGSFPSPASLAIGQYYGHPRNAFWPIMARITGEPLPALPYPQRLRTLLAHRIGLWDVIDCCERDGALDADIRNARHNAFDTVLAVARGRVRICFNGKTAGRLAPRFASRGHETFVLPSTSPAYTLPFDAKLARWREAIEPAVRPCTDAPETESC